MINPLIKAQLNNCRVAQIPEFSEDDTVIHITRGSDITITPYQIGKCYLVELADYIINPPADYTLSANWNQGRVPTHKHYKCQVLNVMGKMVRIFGSGYDIINDTDDLNVWDGWVPQKGIKIIEEYK